MRVGAIGLGRIFEDIHLPQITACPDMDLAAVADVTAERRDRWRDELSVPIHDDMQAILEDPEIDLVCVLTPSRFHHAHVLAALRAGKHVIVEKPMAMNTAEASEMISEAESRDLVFSVHHNRGYDADFGVLQKILADDPIGHIVSIERRVLFDYTEWLAHYPATEYRPEWRMEQAFGGGQLYDWAPHFFDQVLRLAGTAPDRIFCVLRSLKWSDEVDDYAKLIAEWDDGRLAELEVTSFASQVVPSLYILGTEGAITQQRFWSPFIITGANGDSEEIEIAGEHRWQEIHNTVAARILGRGGDLAVTPWHALTIVGLIDGALQSADEHRAVSVHHGPVRGQTLFPEEN
ncbi:MAG: Gfo/Idh/MocA family oxidoreductase [Chloroflexota bacterium]|nr:Gfo/Idh/MocA family oxidoreductase [Chloroflexota bacterium]